MADEIKDQDEARLAETKMSFGEHLDELRTRLLRAFLWSMLGLIIAFVWHRELMEFVLQPFRDVMAELNQDPTVKTSGPAQAFFSHIKVAFVAGVVLTAPMWIWQVWAFIAAGLYSHERGTVYKYVPFCLILFLTGVTFGYTTLIPIGLQYLLSFGDPTVIQNWIGLKEYLGLFTVLTLVLGITFQLPIIMIGLARTGMVSPSAFRAKRKWMILIIFIAGAILTPPDPVTQVLLASPLVLLYEVGIYLSWLGMGANRPPIDWAAAKPFLKKLLFAAVVIAVLWNPMMDAWQTQRAEERLYQDVEQSRPDVKAIARDVLNTDVLTAYRAAEEGREALVAVETADRVYVFKIRATRQKALVVDRDGTDPEGPKRSVTFMPQGQALFEFILLNEVAYREFVPQMIDDLDVDVDEVRSALRSMLEKVTGVGKGLDHDDAKSAFQKWLDAHADDLLKQRDQ